MGKEIEHKYLVVTDSYKSTATENHHIIQGYLSKDVERTVRIRIIDNKAFLTIKGRNDGDTRLEFEYEIPVEDAREMLILSIGDYLEKRRWIVDYGGYRWEVDEFLNRNAPTIAEIELPFSSHNYPLPPFVGEEVTGDPKYYNSNL
ncbi:MAG: CYTH domain-containing protein [Muribaculaceae bacterium]|nr:CYTH domain-containing protein [Muribaculaceae bacterium]